MGEYALQIAAADDDGYRYEYGGGICFRSDVDVAIGGVLGDACHATFRFQDFPFNGRQFLIQSAVLQFHTTMPGNAVQTVRVYCNDVANAGDLVAECNPNNRALTTAVVNWTLPKTLAGATVNSPNLAAPLQEVIDRPDFARGNAVAFCIIGNAGGGDYNGVYVESFEHPTGTPAKLLISARARWAGCVI